MNIFSSLKPFLLEGCLLLCAFFISQSQYAKSSAIDKLRIQYSQNRLKISYNQEDIDSLVYLLSNDGAFIDIVDSEKAYFDQKISSDNFNLHTQITNHGVKVWDRLNKVSTLFHGDSSLKLENDNLVKLLKAIVRYGDLEYNRNPLAGGRFHGSCFAIPRNASNVYFSLYSLMDKVEKNQLEDKTASLACDFLKKLAFQSWTQPLRRDFTDNDVVSVDRFRGHVWWVGGNALDYRPLLESALMQRSERMVDVLHEVCKKSFSYVSQNTYDTSFWIEGMTSDGAGWGHGKQCLVWGYPIDGMIGAFKMLDKFKDTPWDTNLSITELDAIFNYIRGSSFYHYKGVIPPIVDRNNMTKRNNVRRHIPATCIAETLMSERWITNLSPDMQSELRQYVSESKSHDVNMLNYATGAYNGVRYFYNNDDLIKKTPDYHLFINMASRRVDGLESAFPGAAGYNIFANDGVTLFQRDGMEYRNIMGAIDLKSFPGTTTRKNDATLYPLVNWSGYSSYYNYAAGSPAKNGGFSAGFIMLKVDGSLKEKTDTLGLNDKNPSVFGVKSYKSYFMFDNLFLAMGCGITDYSTNKDGEIVTTIEQTYSPKSLSILEKKVDKGFENIDRKEVTPIKHENFTYAVLPKYTTGKIMAGREVRQTRWQDLCRVNNFNDEDQVGVFTMQINHGKSPVNATYAYVVDCSKEQQTVSNYPKILSNTTSLQAAESFDGQQLGAIIYNEKSAIKARMGNFSASAPVSLYVVKGIDSLEITITDAHMNKELTEIVLTTSVPLFGENVEKSGKRYILRLPMPQGAYCGAPAGFTYMLKK